MRIRLSKERRMVLHHLSGYEGSSIGIIHAGDIMKKNIPIGVIESTKIFSLLAHHITQRVVRKATLDIAMALIWCVQYLLSTPNSM